MGKMADFPHPGGVSSRSPIGNIQDPELAAAIEASATSGEKKTTAPKKNPRFYKNQLHRRYLLGGP